jgi:L-ascorbate metabolism protein UlaG (beta-lactamase superfamily)
MPDLVRRRRARSSAWWSSRRTIATASFTISFRRRALPGKKYAGRVVGVSGRQTRKCQTAQPLPLVNTDLASLPSGQDAMVWLGHSSWYLQLAGKRILIDPVFSNYAAPFSFINKAFAGDYPWHAEGMPEIDLLIISHDHYDHLDYATIKALMPKVKRVVTPLGVGSHLRYWGMESAIISEADWNQAVQVSDELTVHVLPARHFSGRGLKRNQTLWASFMFVTPQQKIYYSGDSGYGPHFKAIGEQFGEVDLAIMENGQYDQDWKYIHMMPEETAQAADDLMHARCCRVMPGASCWQNTLGRSVQAAGGGQHRATVATADANVG